VAWEASRRTRHESPSAKRLVIEQQILRFAQDDNPVDDNPNTVILRSVATKDLLVRQQPILRFAQDDIPLRLILTR
jgi:hypothetical protein